MNIGPVYLIVIALVLSYIIGSFPTAYIVVRLRRGVDIRELGSKNMGAMNVFYKVGMTEGFIVLATDIIKGALAVFITYLFGLSLIVQFISGAFVILGHTFPVFLKFRGGKGGATCIGVLIFLIPWAAPIYLGFFLTLMFLTHFPTLSYSIAFICFPLVAWGIYHSGALIIYSIVILLIPALMYIPRVKEMYLKGGRSWRRVLFRRNLKDRL